MTPDPYEGTVLEGEAPNFQLTDQSGRPVALSDFRGQVVVLAFLDSQCREVCPLTAVHLRTAYNTLGDGQDTAVDPQSVAFLGVNVNLEANEIDDVAIATEKWRLNEIANWHFLTGDAGELERVWKAYNVSAIPAEDEELLHTSGVYIIDREGQMRWYVSTPFDESGTPQWTAPLSDLLVKQISFLLFVLATGLLAACGTEVGTPTPLTPTPDPIAQGREAYLRVCAECHGQNGQGYANEQAAPALDDSEHAWHHPDQQIRDWIENGKLGLGREMPAYGDELADDEVDALIAYLHTLWTPEQLQTQQDVTGRYQEP